MIGTGVRIVRFLTMTTVRVLRLVELVQTPQSIYHLTLFSHPYTPSNVSRGSYPVSRDHHPRFHEFAEVQQCVSHPSECRVDGDAGQLRNLAESQLCIVAQKKHFPLLLRQLLQAGFEQAHPVAKVEAIVGRLISIGQPVPERVLLIIHITPLLLLPEVVQRRISGYAHHPGEPPSLMRVRPPLVAPRADDPEECFLEEIIRHVAIAHHSEEKPENAFLMPLDQQA